MSTRIDMAESGGFWWPSADQSAIKALTEVERLPLYLAHVPAARRAVCVQAGGNVGVFARRLASVFNQVFTFEPDVDNFACLNRNLCGTRVSFRHAALMDNNLPVTTRREERHAANYAASYIEPALAGCPAVRVDDLSLPALDLLMLDVEGSELPALKGAALTLMRYSPVVAVELKGLGARYGIHDSETVRWLGTFGYAMVGEIGRDKVFKRK